MMAGLLCLSIYVCIFLTVLAVGIGGRGPWSSPVRQEDRKAGQGVDGLQELSSSHVNCWGRRFLLSISLHRLR